MEILKGGAGGSLAREGRVRDPAARADVVRKRRREVAVMWFAGLGFCVSWGGLGGDVVEDPLSVGFGDVVGAEGDDFGDVVGVEACEFGFEAFEAGGGGFDEGEGFGVGLGVSLPAVDGLDGGDEVDAGRVLLFDE